MFAVGRAAGEIALFKFDDDSVTSYELGAFVFQKIGMMVSLNMQLTFYVIWDAGKSYKKMRAKAALPFAKYPRQSRRSFRAWQ